MPTACRTSFVRRTASRSVRGFPGPIDSSFLMSRSLAQSVEALIRVSGWRAGLKAKSCACLMRRRWTSSSVRSSVDWTEMDAIAIMAAWSSMPGSVVVAAGSISGNISTVERGRTGSALRLSAIRPFSIRIFLALATVAVETFAIAETSDLLASGWLRI